MTAVPIEQIDAKVETFPANEVPWVTIVVDDPVNLIEYVAYVFQTVFGWDEQKAMKHTMEVHEDGQSVVFSGSKDDAQNKAEQVGTYGLWTKVSKQ